MRYMRYMTQARGKTAPAKHIIPGRAGVSRGVEAATLRSFATCAVAERSDGSSDNQNHSRVPKCQGPKLSSMPRPQQHGKSARLCMPAAPGTRRRGQPVPNYYARAIY